ncbi:glycosyltransferase [Methylobacterium persicinum]|uniref:Glycosyltransferase involved in cell wall biosynthesis n=1 Tax=Methylobacterium persicinum TaxID=374426 RepID=A0ABU0HPC3_9HYPH|nr:glycosyltransferase [Methylobacterium persicinum]MDQ0444169.1 glycosyltransferase involved in cell wall biosynthesis [Methylobacterium persicinum]GJE36131.1 Phosphatidyl-myo-inositol mannosyltransferase [Methylobacterium persicinum]
MRIAILAHLRHPIAPPFAGGLEAYTWNLAEGLRGRGHEVVLFASGDSDPRVPLDPIIPVHQERRFPGLEHQGDAGLKAHLDEGYAKACDRIAGGGFDVVHNNSLSRLALEPRRLAATPTVTSLHVPPYNALRWFVHASAVPGHRITATSDALLRAWWPEGAPPGASVLHNGIDPAAWPYSPRGDGSAVWSGRLAAVKGAHHAIAAARRAGLPLTLFGPIEEPEYWAARVAPNLGGPIRYGGHLAGPALAAEIGRASVFLFTPCWDEPFGLAAIEAMACGLPVAGFARGAASEIVGEAGCLVRCGDEAALAGAIGTALTIPRTVARARVQRLFTRELWLDRCEVLYALARPAEAAVLAV